ncbi:MAG: TIGR04282 family arsenosugar biosynthesis glycosyltransferase [Crocinitomicaceae bacterium]
MSDKLLIIFARNPVQGKVKTRLAQGIGDEEALKIYHELLDFTIEESSKVSAEKMLYYSDFIPEQQLNNDFSIALQTGEDLGERMKNAFSEGFKKGYGRIILIGSDSFEIDANDIQKAFFMLNDKDTVIGPATDGGYYLIGLKAPFEPIFTNKPWSTDVIFKRTYLELMLYNKTIALLEEKSDIDTLEDLEEHYKKTKKSLS